MKVILCCECGDTPAYSKDAFSILFPNEKIPEVFAGDSTIAALADRFPSTSDAYSYIKGIAQNKEKYALAIDATEDGEVISITNLLTGRVTL